METPVTRPVSESEFEPVAWLPGRHLQTIVPSFLPAPRAGNRTEILVVPVDSDASVEILIDEPAGKPRGTLLLVHGLGGSARSGYIRRTARRALDEGWRAARMNCRTCGGTERLSRTLYNAGQSDDVGRVLQEMDGLGFPRPFAAAGFSMGGNLVLRYSGRAGADALPDAVIGVNPSIDLERCNRVLERPENRIYQIYYTHTLCRHMSRIRRVRSVPGPRPAWPRIGTLRAFDRIYTAPDAGYPSAESYYAEASAGPWLAGNRTPALVLSAANDPLIPTETFDPYRHQPTLEFLHPPCGGHVGYWQKRRPRFWGAEAILSFLTSVA
jgi:predicted alpha/beta-fold hydrolase